MRYLFALLIFAFALIGNPGCSHVQQAATDCHAQPAAVDAVNKVIGHDTYAAEIDALNFVACVAIDAVKQVQALLSGDSSALAAHDPETTVKLSHANAWLAAHGVMPVSTVKAGLPGGGHQCCWRPGTWHTIDTQSCGNGTVVITQANLFSLCICAPAQLWC